MSNLIVEIEDKLKELETTLQNKQNLFVNTLNNQDINHFNNYINTIKQITKNEELKELTIIIKDFNSLINYLKTYQSSIKINFAKQLSLNLSNTIKIINQEIREEELEQTKEEIIKEIQYIHSSVDSINNSKKDFEHILSSFLEQQNTNGNISKNEYKKRLNKLESMGFYKLKFSTKELNDLINNKYFDLIKLGIEAKGYSVHLFKYGIPAIMPILKENPKMWPQIGEDLVKLGIEAKENLSDLFESSIPAIMPIVKENPQMWPQIGEDLVKLGIEAKEKSRSLFVYGIPTIMPIVKENPKIWPDLVKLGIEAKKKSEFLFVYGIPAIMPIVKKNPQMWPQVGEDLVKLGIEAKKKSEYFFIFGIPAIMPIVKENPKIWPDLVKLGIEAKENSSDLFKSGIPAIMPFINSNKFNWGIVNQFLLALIKRYPNSIKRIIDILTSLKPEINSENDLTLFWEYIYKFSILDIQTFQYFKTLSLNDRKKHLEEHINKYQSIIMGEKIQYSKDDIKYIFHAINSKNLTMEKITQTLSRYSEKVFKLKDTKFKPFEFELKEVGKIELFNKLQENLFNYYKEIFQIITQNQNVEEIDLNEFLKENKNINQEILGTQYSQEIAWRYIILKTFYLLGEENQNNLKNILDTDFNNLAKLREIYYHIEEFYNDTIKDNLLKLDEETQEYFLKNIHRPLSKIDLLGKELKKFKEVKTKNSKNIICIPSKEPLDLFYGYYGENCTSSAPQELLNPAFTPVRFIINNEIQGCLHFYEITYEEKNILAILGIEPRSSLVNQTSNDILFKELIKSIIKEAKRLKYDMVALPVNPIMHSNRGQISSLIAQEIRNKKHLDINIEFPKEHNGYTTKGLRVIWENKKILDKLFNSS